MIHHHPLSRGALISRRIGAVRAVDGVSFDLRAGESLALVGESGCGKTTAVMQILSLYPPQSGSITLLGADTAALGDGRAGRTARAPLRRAVSVVFQDPLASLDPRLPVGEVIAEPLLVHGHPVAARRARTLELLGLVNLDPEHANRYPHELSGGQRQRVAIARALALEPRVLILDEPVSALDVSVRAGVLNLLSDLKQRLGLAYLFVSHDLAAVRQIADRVAVMHLGRLVEVGPAARIFTAPTHPYTRALISAVPIPDPARERSRRRIVLDGDPPSPLTLTGHAEPLGCSFRSRCPLFARLDAVRRERCENTGPQLQAAESESESVPGDEHVAACHHAPLWDAFITRSPTEGDHAGVAG